jgi:hypothetical protein
MYDPLGTNIYIIIMAAERLNNFDDGFYLSYVTDVLDLN